MSILDKIEKTSFKKIFWVSLLVGIMITIPVVVLMVQTETKIFSRADFVPPTPKPLRTGPVPTEEAKIEAVDPFLGKEGDIIVIRGVHFGYYPKGAYAQIGTLKIPENHLVSWEDNKISLYLPTAASSDKVSINNGRNFVTYPRILTVYRMDTKTKIVQDGGRLLATNASGISRVVYYDQSGERHEKQLPKPITSGSEAIVLIDYPHDQKIVWMTVFDYQNAVIPFYVSPDNFGI